MLLVTFFLCALTDSSKMEMNRPTVQTLYGKVQGQILTTIQEPHSQYYAFRGIPYATPPLGKLRFQPPVKPKPWILIKSCENYGSKCLQMDSDGSVTGSEDCLTLNVFTKELNVSNLKPVMFWIHGGAHLRGSSSQYGPDYFMEKSIVLVTANYRLNVFGFFTVNDKNAYGNVAIKDQIAALEWVQDNIAKFGGDPTKVTIFGESSGADSVSLLQLCPRARGLFQQIIAESGTSLNPRYLQRNPLTYAYNLAKYFDIKTDTNENIVKGLQKIDAKELTKAANLPEATGYHINLDAAAFFPIIEAENDKAVLTRSPYELYETGAFNKVPFIVGYNSNEGTLGLSIASKMNIENFDSNNELFYSRSLNNNEESKEVGTVVRNYFLGNDSAKNMEKFSKFLAQELLIRGIRKGIDFLGHYSKGYFYKFVYEGTHTTQHPGVGHGEELQYLFVQKEKIENLTDTDVLTRKRMIEMWTNFAIFGNPTPEGKLLGEALIWKKCDDSISYLEIGENLAPKTNPDPDEYEFWQELFKEYGKPPYQTY